MLMCYVDESGDTGSLDPNERNSQPIFLISAVIVRQSALKQLTRSIVELKRQFFPSHGIFTMKIRFPQRPRILIQYATTRGNLSHLDAEVLSSP